MCNKNKQLESAVQGKNLEEVKALLLAGADVNMRVPGFGAAQNNDTLLHCTYSAKIVKELLLRGARVDQTNRYRETPLHAAITLGKDLEFIQELLKHGAAVDPTDRKGNTPLNQAVKRGSNIKIIEELLKYGANINIRNREDRLYEQSCSSWNNAIRWGHTDQAKLMIKYGLINNFENDYKRIINLDGCAESISNILSCYLEDCICEVVKMKTDEIKIGLPLYDIVKKNFDTQLLNNNSFCSRLLNIDYSIDYPIYNDFILYQIKPFLKRANLLEKIKRTQIYNINPGENGISVRLDPHSIPFITQYLSLDDLLNFVKASTKCDIQSSSLSDPQTEQDEESTSKDAKRARLY